MKTKSKKTTIFCGLTSVLVMGSTQALAQNTAYGVDALNAAGGFANSAFGREALFFNYGFWNTAIGAYALRNNTEG